MCAWMRDRKTRNRRYVRYSFALSVFYSSEQGVLHAKPRPRPRPLPRPGEHSSARIITPGVVLPLSAGLTYVAVAYGGQITRRGGGRG
jgi:hypothetical protein